jgi:hypothetical protein
MKRKLIEAEKSAPEIAKEVVERQGKDGSITERLKLRREKSAPLAGSAT